MQNLRRLRQELERAVSVVLCHCTRQWMPRHRNIPQSLSQFIVTHFTKMLLPG